MSLRGTSTPATALAKPLRGEHSVPLLQHLCLQSRQMMFLNLCNIPRRVSYLHFPRRRLIPAVLIAGGGSCQR